jgi:hypothetical protein
MKLIKGKKYNVKWIDAAGSSDWTDEEDLDKMIAQYEKGVEQDLTFIKESKKFYAFTSGKHLGDENYCDVHLIPKDWCSIKRLRN